MNILIFCILSSFIISLLIGQLLIPALHRLKFGQYIKKEVPEAHKKKAGIPTMGGIIFISSSIITNFIFVKHITWENYICLFALIAFGSIGLLDDGLKIFRKQNEGLTSKQKMLLLIIVSIVFSFIGYSRNSIGSSIVIPFYGKILDLGIYYVPFIIFYYVSLTNSVNITDGLDGLCTSVTLIVMTFFILVSFALGYYSVSIFCSTLVGSLLGFLRYNSFPAKIIMGDTGSLALGGAIGIVGMVLKLPLIVIIVGGVYVLETLSDIIQITSYKLTRKRVFKMAPIHHSLELSGVHEAKIVSIFSILTTILCLLGYLALLK
jgi:phospho-N-acetylmuramoyl-pentapeptide-transferase